MQPASADLREHICDELGSTFITALSSCPVCHERLDVGPSFPSSVKLYLRKTKAANKLNVTFDYENEIFVPVEDGEFVLISNADDAVHPIVIPRSATFATPRDFYEFYQDFYVCPQPNAGEVHVLEPATVVQTGAGYKLRAPGVLDVMKVQSKNPPPQSRPLTEARPAASHSIKDEVLDVIEVQSKIKPATPKTPPQPDQLPDSEPPRSRAAHDEAGTLCSDCGTLIESRYAFCWKCGSALAPKESPAMRTAPSEDEDDEQTVQHDPQRVRSPILSWETAPPAQKQQLARGSVLKLVVAAFVAILLGSLGVLLTHSLLRTASVTAAEPPTAEARVDATVLTTAPDSQPKSSPTTAQKPEDYELSKLREKWIAADRSERSQILQSFNRTEKKYPNDYRFPYERAKLAVEGREKTSHHDAFTALSVAAEKAISSGKASEMLENLQKDSGGDFQRLSHGHREWVQLQEALRNKDVRVLDAKMGL
ncbi:MAG TPA: zinc ribbon domain-containing protein [Pyrinomonadaceae bacterium]